MSKAFKVYSSILILTSLLILISNVSAFDQLISDNDSGKSVFTLDFEDLEEVLEEVEKQNLENTKSGKNNQSFLGHTESYEVIIKATFLSLSINHNSLTQYKQPLYILYGNLKLHS